MVEGLHAFFELTGMIAIGYVISRLILTIPAIRNFLIGNGKQSVKGTDNPNPIVNCCKPENFKNDFSNSAPIENLNNGKDYPLGKNTHDVPAAPFSEKANEPAHIERIIANPKDHNGQGYGE